MKKKRSLIFLTLGFIFVISLGFSNKAYAGSTFGTASSISVNKTITGKLTEYDYSAFYKFTLTKPGNVTLSIKNVSNAQWEAQLLNSSANEIISFYSDDSSSAVGSSEKQVGLPAGTYYVKMSDWYDTKGVSYQFQVKYSQSDFFETEFNDTAALSDIISVNKNYKGSINHSSDSDYFKFTIKKPGNLAISMKNLSYAQWEVQLLNESANEIISFDTDDSSSAVGSSEKQVGIPAGTYYVRISDRYDANGHPYQFQVKYTESNNYEKEFNNTISKANSISLNTTYEGIINNSSDIDFYKFTIPQTSSAQLILKQKAGTEWKAIILNSRGNTIKEVVTDYSKNNYAYINTKFTKGTYYLAIIDEYYETNVPYDFKVRIQTNALKASQIKVANNKGKSDVVNVSKIAKGDVIRIYNSDGKQLASATSKGTSVTINIKQLGKKSSNVSVSVTKSGQGESSKTKVSYSGEISDALKTSQIKITNNKGKSDVVDVSKIAKGDIIRIYNSDGKQLASTTSKGTSVKINIAQLGKKASNVYVSVTKSGQRESSRTKVSYSGEVSDALKASQVKITNNKGKSDKITVRKISKGDLIKAYSSKTGGKAIVSGTSTGSSKTLSVKQLGKKAGKVYVTITKSGQRESARTAVSYVKEK